MLHLFFLLKYRWLGGLGLVTTSEILSIKQKRLSEKEKLFHLTLLGKSIQL